MAQDQPSVIVSRSATGVTWHEETSSVPTDRYKRYRDYFTQQHDMPDAVASFLAKRGLTPDTLPVFLAPRLRDLLPNPSDFKDMDTACALLAEAIIARRAVGIFGDYDVDGACSAAILSRFLAAFNVPAEIHIPDRFTEGYGPNLEALKQLKDKGAELIITVDCGITAHRPLADAQALGLSVIVIDHHQAGTELPRAKAVVNPNRLDDDSGQGALCAAAMVFMSCVGTMRHLREAGHITNETAPINLLNLLDMVGMATICDIVPLTPLNRAFVKQGLKILKQRQNVGLRCLADKARLNTPPTAHSFGFLLGPRINAGGRIGNASLGAKLLTTEDEAIATSLAIKLDELNQQRRDIEAEVQAAAIYQAEVLLENAPDTKVLIVSQTGWHEGVIGIVAGRLKDKFHRPAIVISLDETGHGKGSARGIAGFNLGNAVMAAHQAGILAGGGGHAMAAGLSLETGNIAAFRAFMNDSFTKQVGSSPPPSLKITMTTPLSACQKSLVDWLGDCAPFGPSFSEPRMMLQSVSLKYARWIGSDEQHFSCTITDGTGIKLRAISFGLRSKLEAGLSLETIEGRKCHLAGKLKADDYRGGDAVQFLIDDLVFTDSISD